MSREIIYKYKINTWGVVRYRSIGRRKGYADLNFKRSINENSLKNLKKREEIKGLTKSGKRNIIQSVIWLTELANTKYYITKNGKRIYYKIQMLTLTFPQKEESGTAAKECLNRWLANARKTYGMENYVWRAERHKSGGVHFHIITDADFTLDRLLKSWNLILARAGYTTIKSINSSDVKRFSKSSTYIAKYAGKEGDGETIDGNVWGRSRSLIISKIQDDLKDLGEWAFEMVKFAKGQYCRRITDYAEILFIDLSKVMRWLDIGKYIRKYVKWLVPYPSTTTQYSYEIQRILTTKQIIPI